MNQDFEFEDQRSDEEIILIKKRHPWVLFKPLMIMAVIIAAMILSIIIWMGSIVTSIVLVLGLLALVFYGFIVWFIYSNDLFILTDQRIIDINQSGFFSRRVSEAELENILNITYEIKGVMQSLLNFGRINVDTSGSDSNYLILKNIENPHFVQEKIVEARRNFLKVNKETPKQSFAMR